MLWRTRPLLLVAVGALLFGVLARPADAQQTAGLAETRAAAEQAAQDYADAQAALGELDGELTELRAQQDTAAAEMAALQDDVSRVLVEQYMEEGTSVAAVVPEGDPNEQARASALVSIITQRDTDVLETYRAAEARRAAAAAEIEARLADQEDLLAELEATEERLASELALLQEIENERLAEEQRQAAARAQESAEAAARAAQLTAEQDAREAGAAAAASTTTTAAGDDGDDPATPATSAPPVSEAPGTPTDPVVPPPPSGGMLCPVPGSAFIDSYGAPRPQGWAHQGVDMMAPSGTPIVAPVSGVVTHRGNSVGGLAFHLDGSDGRYYYGAHLSAYGQSGSVQAGTVIGYVGNTGDAAATAPHLHLEIHIGGSVVNPYPYVAAVC